MTYEIVALVSLLIIGFSVLLMTLAAKKFVKGEFKSILTWLLIGMWFMAFPYTLFIWREVTGTFGDLAISWVIYVSMVIVGVCIFKAAKNLYEFSKSYGFADIDIKVK